MRVVTMLLMQQLTSHGIDPAFLEVFWLVAGSIGAVVLISVVPGGCCVLALYLLSLGDHRPVRPGGVRPSGA